MTPTSSLLAATAARLRAAGCVFAEEEARLLVVEADTSTELGTLVERRVSGVPLEQVVGWAEFCGLRIAVTPGVFVPRRRTELLVREAERLVREAARPTRDPARPLVVVDVCCGSGAVGAAVAARLSQVGLPLELHAVDVDPAAVACARRNLPEPAKVHTGDLYEPLPDSLRGRVDVLLANAPYVPTGEIRLMPPEARLHEARVALDGGADGLAVQRRVLAGATSWLANGGHVLVETSGSQAPRTMDAVARSGLRARVVREQENSATVVVGTRTRYAYSGQNESFAPARTGDGRT